jgi:hypothetical protein
MIGSSNLTEDVFSVILSHIYESKTIQNILGALSKHHPLFLPTLTRLLQLPVTLDRSTQPANTKNDTLTSINLLLAEGDNELGGPTQLAKLIRHLIILPEVTVDGQKRTDDRIDKILSALFTGAQALRKVDWYDALGLSEDHLKALERLSGFEDLSLTCDPNGGRPMFDEEESSYK